MRAPGGTVTHDVAGSPAAKTTKWPPSISMTTTFPAAYIPTQSVIFAEILP